MKVRPQRWVIIAAPDLAQLLSMLIRERTTLKFAETFQVGS
jgi:hypothetical protein